MAAIAGMAVVTGIIAACVGPLYYCKETCETREDSQTQRTRDEERQGSEKKVYCIEISKFHKDKEMEKNEETSNSCSRESDVNLEECARRNENDGTRQENREFNDTTTSATIGSENTTSEQENRKIRRVAPAKPPRASRKIQNKINTTNKDHSESEHNSNSDQLIESLSSKSGELLYQTCQQKISSDTSSSIEPGRTETVKVQIERNPFKSISTNNEIDLLNSDSKIGEASNSVSNSYNQRSTNYVSAVSSGETSYLSLPKIVYKGPLNRTIDAFTSTKISLRGFEIEDLHDKVSKHEEQLEIVKCSNEECGNSVLREVLSLVSHEEDTEIEVSGFTLSRDALLQLMMSEQRNLSDNSSKCSSFLKEEPQNVSIRIRKYRSKHKKSTFKRKNFFDSCSAKTIYRNLPSKLDNTKLSKLLSRSSERSTKRSTSLRAKRNVDNRANRSSVSSILTEDESSSYFDVRFPKSRDTASVSKNNKSRRRRSLSNFWKFFKRTKLFKIFR